MRRRLRHPHEHVDAQLLRPAQSQRNQPILHDGEVDLYPNSSLYKDKEEMEALQLGAVQMLAPSPDAGRLIHVKVSLRPR
jgi:TRAP-type C4-dicarboxylate transport system substrate-binding protein